MTAELDLTTGRHAAAPRALQSDTRCSLLERMPKWLICVPLTIQWLWLGLRYRSLTLPSAANPAITSGGLVGEGKLEYFSGMGAVARARTAPFCAFATHTAYTPEKALGLLRKAGIAFPLVVKPDLGLCGYGVRRIDHIDALMAYLRVFPANEFVVAQPYLWQEGEAGIFYARDPGASKGRLIGLALRYFPRVTGDGRRSISELVAADLRAGRLLRSARHELQENLNRVPARGEIVRLATIGSTRVGGLYRDGAALMTPQLAEAIDAIALDMPEFHFGRFDVRFTSLQDLARGEGFTIMEVNGAGSEAIEAWDPETGVMAGFRTIFAKQRTLFAIGHAMRNRGVRPISLRRLTQLNRRQQRLIAAYPPSN
jgi:hypothetical protein